MNENNDKSAQVSQVVYNLNKGITGFISSWTGIIAGFIGALVIFFVASIKPDGSIDLAQTLLSPAYWILTGVTISVVITVSIINYRSTRQKERETPQFISTLQEFKKAKDDVRDHLDVLPLFCADKTTQAREELIRDLLEQAGYQWKHYIMYDKSLAEMLDDLQPDDWQLSILQKIPSIEVEPLRARDVLQEDFAEGKARGFLGPSAKQLEGKFVKSNMVSKVASVLLTSLVFTMGVTLSNWLTGAANAFGVISAIIGAITAASDDTKGPLRDRYITRINLLIEFKSVLPRYITAPAVVKLSHEAPVLNVEPVLAAKPAI